MHQKQTITCDKLFLVIANMTVVISEKQLHLIRASVFTSVYAYLMPDESIRVNLCSCCFVCIIGPPMCTYVYIDLYV